MENNRYDLADAKTNEDKVAARQFICEPQNYFGETMKELRFEKRLTQKEAAELLGLTQSQWSLYELGKSKPNIDVIIQIAEAFDLRPADLIDRSLTKSKYFQDRVARQDASTKTQSAVLV